MGNVSMNIIFSRAPCGHACGAVKLLSQNTQRAYKIHTYMHNMHMYMCMSCT